MRGLSFILFLAVIISGVFPLQGETRHFNHDRKYLPFRYATEEGLLIENPTDTLRYDYYPLEGISSDFSLRFRGRNINGHPAKKYRYRNTKGKMLSVGNPHWGFFITTPKDTIAISVKGTEKERAFNPVAALKVTLYDISSEESKEIIASDRINPYDGDNLWKVEHKDGSLKIYGGEGEMRELIDYSLENGVSGFGYFAGWGDNVLISDIDVYYTLPRNDGSLDFSAEDIEEYLSGSDDTMEGYWVIFDRDLEENLLKLGGDYTLACIKTDGGYDFIYLDGAAVNSAGWQPGQLKIRLDETPFEGVYNVVWLDALHEPMNREIKAQTGEGDTLLIQFPYQSSKVRLRKIEKGRH